MTSLLEDREIAAIEPVFAELLYGVRTPRDKDIVFSYWQILPKLDFKNGTLIEVSQFANNNNYHNLGVGLIDASIIYPVLANKYQLWTLDKKILKVVGKESRYEV